MPPPHWQAGPRRTLFLSAAARAVCAAVVDAALAANPDARLCISAIALETLQEAVAALTAHGLTAQVTQIAVSRSRAAGSLHLLHGEQPGFLDREGVKMLQLVLAAPRSGSGKTTAACALLAALTAARG